MFSLLPTLIVLVVSVIMTVFVFRTFPTPHPLTSIFILTLPFVLSLILFSPTVIEFIVRLEPTFSKTASNISVQAVGLLIIFMIMLNLHYIPEYYSTTNKIFTLVFHTLLLFSSLILLATIGLELVKHFLSLANILHVVATVTLFLLTKHISRKPGYLPCLILASTVCVVILSERLDRLNLLIAAGLAVLHFLVHSRYTVYLAYNHAPTRRVQYLGYPLTTSIATLTVFVLITAIPTTSYALSPLVLGGLTASLKRCKDIL
jgi:hypothetical protein